MTGTFKNFFSRDFTLLHLEIWYRGEAMSRKPWLGKRQSSWPYLAFHRTEGTVRALYDTDGVTWMQNRLTEEVHNIPQFLSEVAERVREAIQPIRSIYEQEQTLTLPALKQFLAQFEQGFPWFEAMWWMCEMKPSAFGQQRSAVEEVRNETKPLSVGVDNVIRNSLQQAFPRARDFEHVLREEEVFSHSIPSEKVLAERDREFWYTAGTLHIGMTQTEFETQYELSIQKPVVPEGTMSVKGKTAYPGTVQGRVRRVLGHADIPLLQDGEVLVSTMTMPDFLPAIQKAAALVTDEGGMTSHAAILARELQKPCVVGTRIATQLFHDGDQVTVDANHAIVRKIH